MDEPPVNQAHDQGQWLVGKTGISVAAALAAYAVARFAPPLAGLTDAGQAVLGTVLAGTILWIAEALPLGVTALIVLVLLAIAPGQRLADALSGFTSDVTFFLVGAVAIGAAVEASGLAERAARFLSRRAAGSPTRLYWQMIAALPLLAFLLSSAITRNAILIPAYREALETMGLARSGRVGRALMLALGMLNPLASSALLTGGITSITAATLLGGFSWARWFALMALPYYVLIGLGAVYLRLMVGRFEGAAAREQPGACSGEVDTGSPIRTCAKQESTAISDRVAGEMRFSSIGNGCNPPTKPLSPPEIRTLLVLGATSALWLSDAIHGLSPAVPALLAAIVLLSPKVGVLSWKAFEAKLSWGLILTVGASLSLARLMAATGAAGWLGQQFTGHLALLAEAPLVLIVALVLSVALIHLAITNLAACIALLLPVTATIAEAAGLNPVLCGLVVTIVVDAVILYPVQTAANLLAYESGYFDAANVRRLGLGMLVITGAVVLLVLPYWAMLGMPLRPR